jgi:hypothetical protein
MRAAVNPLRAAYLSQRNRPFTGWRINGNLGLAVESTTIVSPCMAILGRDRNTRSKCISPLVIIRPICRAIWNKVALSFNGTARYHVGLTGIFAMGDLTINSFSHCQHSDAFWKNEHVNFYRAPVGSRGEQV